MVLVASIRIVGRYTFVYNAEVGRSWTRQSLTFSFNIWIYRCLKWFQKYAQIAPALRQLVAKCLRLCSWKLWKSDRQTKIFPPLQQSASCQIPQMARQLAALSHNEFMGMIKSFHYQCIGQNTSLQINEKFWTSTIDFELLLSLKANFEIKLLENEASDPIFFCKLILT